MTSSHRALFVLGLGVFLIAGFVILLERIFEPDQKIKAVPPVSPMTVTFQPTTFAALEGWTEDPLEGVLETFLRTCQVSREGENNSRPFGGGSHLLSSGAPVAGLRSDWLGICEQAQKNAENGESPSGVKAFFEAFFTPVHVTGEGNSEGLFTGYYEPELRGAAAPKGPDWVPLLSRPDDLVSIELGDFREDLKGKRLAGRIVGGALKPFEDRAQIEAGKLGEEARPLVWVDSAIDAFFLHIQGSGRVRLDTGEIMRVGYAGQNGHPYVAIGRVLVQRGEIPLEKISMQSIRAWLTANPEDAAEVMGTNTSYIFFTKLKGVDPELGPLGAAGTPLTPRRSLAIDRKFHALGVPVWLETTLPPEETGAGPQPLRRLMIAQDTGGAIQGAVRGDVFFGAGREATDIAGRMKQAGTMTLLLPKALAARLIAHSSFQPEE